MKLAQRNIRGNHVAVVPRGRAGPEVRILDAQPDVEEESSMAEKPAEQAPDISIGAFAKACGQFKEALTFLGFRPEGTPAVSTTDADPGAVELDRSVRQHRHPEQPGWFDIAIARCGAA